MRRIALPSLLALAMIAAVSGHAAASFDGAWTVLIITEKGDCDRAYRYEVGVTDGRVHYRGTGSAEVSGTVSPQGAVKVRIMLGDKGAQGTGKLTAKRGQGTWQGSGPNATCAGHWEAERH